MGITLSQMHSVAASEAERIDIVQTALVKAGDLKVWDPGQRWRKEAFEGMCRLIDRVCCDQVILDRLKMVTSAQPERKA